MSGVPLSELRPASQPIKFHSLLANFLAILLEESIIVKLIIVGHLALPWHVVGI